MALVPRRGLLAIAAVLDISLSAGERPIPAKTLAEHYDLAPRHLEPLLQALVHSGILRGVRGPRGGYLLGREADEITLEQILSAALTDESDSLDLMVTSPMNDIVVSALLNAEQIVAHALRSITLQILIDETTRKAVRYA